MIIVSLMEILHGKYSVRYLCLVIKEGGGGGGGDLDAQAYLDRL